MFKKKIKFNNKEFLVLILGSLLIFILINKIFRRSINNSHEYRLSNNIIGKSSPDDIKIIVLKPKIVKIFSEFTGTIEAKNILILKSEIYGKIKQILAKEGDNITKNQIIMEFDPDNLQAKLLESQAKLASTKARLSELETGNRIEDLKEAKARLRGAKVRLNNTKIGDSIEEIAQARANLNSSQASLELAQQRVARYKMLKEQGVISIDEYQEHITILRRARADLEQTKRRLSQLKKRRLADLDELTTVVETELQNLQRLQAGPRREVIAQAKADVIEASAQLQTSQIHISKTKVKAPFSGVVENIFTRDNEYVKEGDSLISLINNNTLRLRLTIPLKYSSRLSIGLPVEIIDDSEKIITTGKISFISSNIIKNSQSIFIRASFNNLNQKLLNGQFVRARIIWQKNSSLSIPAKSVYHIGKEKFVFIVKDNNSGGNNIPNSIAKRVKVQLNSLEGGDYKVTNGLTAYDKLIVSNNKKLKDGMFLQKLDSHEKKVKNSN